MMVSKRSQVWLLVFGVLALTICIERASAQASYCAAGNLELLKRVPFTEGCDSIPWFTNCSQWCPDHGRYFVEKFARKEQFDILYYDCFCCCGNRIPRPPTPPSPPPTSPPSPPSPSPPPPPPPTPSPPTPSPPSPPSPSPSPPCPSSPPSGSCCGCCNTDIDIQISIKSGGDNVKVSSPPSSLSTSGTCNAL